MADFSAKDVQRLRQTTGAGMMDAKRALTEAAGDFEVAAKWLREKGLAQQEKRKDRENTEGTVAVGTAAGAVAIAQLRSETDFVAKNPDFKGLVEEIAQRVAAEGDDAIDQLTSRIDDLKVSLKENIELGEVVRFEAAPGNVLSHYLHVQNERGVNAVLVELAGGTEEQARELAMHVAFARPPYLARPDVPETEIAEKRQEYENISRNEGKPEQALPKIVEGRLGGFYREVCLLEQKFVKDEKQTVEQYLGDAKVVRFAQVEIG
jgi:elongation factor Ts